MARISGIDIPREKRVEVALTYIYGIGLTRAQAILEKSGVNPDIRVKDLDDSDIQKLRAVTEEFTLEGDLRRQEGMALKRLQDIERKKQENVQICTGSTMKQQCAAAGSGVRLLRKMRLTLPTSLPDCRSGRCVVPRGGA